MTRPTNASALILLMFCSCLASGCFPPATETRVRQPEPPPPPSYPSLAGYGSWSDVPPFGWAWKPNVPYDWAPFTEGRWAWTDRGWMWMGDEPFAWLVYHYGSWDDDPGLGWIWIPGDEWSPARVRWETRGDYVSWAPLLPPGVTDRQEATVHGYGWTTVQIQNFPEDHVGSRRVKEGGYAPEGGAPSTIGRPPDVTAVERSARRTIGQMRIEPEQVREGGRSLQRVRVPAPEPGNREQPRSAGPVTPPPPPSIAPPANRPVPRTAQPEPRPAEVNPASPPVRQARPGTASQGSAHHPKKAKAMRQPKASKKKEVGKKAKEEEHPGREAGKPDR